MTKYVPCEYCGALIHPNGACVWCLPYLKAKAELDAITVKKCTCDMPKKENEK